MEMEKDPNYGPAQCDGCSRRADDVQLVILPDCSGKDLCKSCRRELQITLKELE